MLYRIISASLALLGIIAATAFCAVHTLDDFNSQDRYFNSFGGNRGVLMADGGQGSLSFDTAIHSGLTGASLRLDYNVANGYTGFWQALIGKLDGARPDIEMNHALNFTDLYGSLLNSSDNPSQVEGIVVDSLLFSMRGSQTGSFDHIVKVELKDQAGNSQTCLFTLNDSSGWQQFSMAIQPVGQLDLSQMKELVFVIDGSLNSDRSSHLYIDDLELFTGNEPEIDFAWMPDVELLDFISQRYFHYFLTYTDNLGFAMDRSSFADLISVGAIGFQLASFCIGDAQGWAGDLEQRTFTVLDNLLALPMGPEPGSINAGNRGFFYHFLDANTGLRKNSNVELSLYDTMLLMYGVLAVKAHFSENLQIQSLANQLYERVEWDWMVDTAPSENQWQFHLGWMPEGDIFLGHVDGYTDEALLVDILALGSPSYPVDIQTYHARSRYFGAYPAGSEDLAAAWSGSAFNYFFADCFIDINHPGFDNHPEDPVNLWENNHRGILANVAFCADHADDVSADGDDDFLTYANGIFGLTACDNLVDPETNCLSQYFAFGALPTEQNIRYPETSAPHLGTIATYGALSSINYVPQQTMTALHSFISIPEFAHQFLGMPDAFSLDPSHFLMDNGCQAVLDDDSNLIVQAADWLNGNWINRMRMGINEGPALLCLQNHQDNIIHTLFASCSPVQHGLEQIFLQAPQITSIHADNGEVTIEWTSQIGVELYRVYSATSLDEPMSAISDVVGTSLTMPIEVGQVRLFEVRAIAGE